MTFYMERFHEFLILMETVLMNIQTTKSLLSFPKKYSNQYELKYSPGH